MPDPTPSPAPTVPAPDGDVVRVTAYAEHET